VWDRETEEPGGRAPAPGELAVVQAFLNSADLEDGIERFDTPESLRQWLVDHDLLDSTVVLTASDLTRLIAVREALRDLLSFPEEPEAAVDASARLADAQVGALLEVAVTPGGAVQLVPVAEGIDGAIARLMAIVYRAGIDGSWQRLKTCRNQQCRWVFYDASKNRSGAWCTMAICGAKRKARAYRRRRSGIDTLSSPPDGR
jgi:predicted RNA-binding Zn ribbon-like protein